MASVTRGQRTAYIGRYRSDDGWKLQMIGYGPGGVGAIWAEVDVPDDSEILALADEFLYAIAAAKDLAIKARRRDDS